jgi:hypothetical protein
MISLTLFTTLLLHLLKILNKIHCIVVEFTREHITAFCIAFDVCHIKFCKLESNWKKNWEHIKMPAFLLATPTTSDAKINIENTYLMEYFQRESTLN